MRSIPSDLSAKIKQSLQTLGNVGDPKLKIAVSRAKSTITDANYWTVETIREKAGLGDVSVAPRRLFKQYGGPDRLYEIHVDNGQVSTAIREYPDKLKQGWQPQFTLGPCANPGSVALAFDGEWELYRDVWRLRTHETPWIFWVDSTGILWGQLWSDEITKIELASGVDGSKGVKALRGWDNPNITAKDQGIVVAYIKSGRPYYRTFAYQDIILQAWEVEREVIQFTGIAVGLNLFLTNDYRLGMLIESSIGSITWLLTTRNWAGMALIPEHIQVDATAEVSLTTVAYMNIPIEENITLTASVSLNYIYASTFNQFSFIQNVNDGFGNWGKIIQFQTQHPIFNWSINDFVIYDDLGIPYMPLNITENNGLFTLTFENFNNFKNVILLKTNAIGLINEAGYMFNTFEISFMPINLIPTEIPLPEVLEVWNE